MSSSSVTAAAPPATRPMTADGPVLAGTNAGTAAGTAAANAGTAAANAGTATATATATGTDTDADADAGADGQHPPGYVADSGSVCVPLSSYPGLLVQLTPFERGLVAFRMALMAAQIALAVSALALADRAACAPTYSTALFASAIVFSLVLLCAPRYFQPARRTSQDPVLIAAEAQRRRRINNIDLLCLIPFIIENVAVFSVSSCNVDAPLLFYSNLTLVIIGYMYFCSPLTWCILAVAFSPCLFLLFHYMQRTQALRANPFDGRMGATEDIINAIPVFTYRKKVVPEPRPDIEAPADSPVSLAAVPPPAASAQTTSHASPASQASEPSGSSSPAKAAPPKRKRRKFNLLPSIFKRGKGSASDAGADADADAAQAAAQAAAGPKELELDAEDAVCCICLGEYDEGESLRQLACNHHFHVDCIDEWLKLNAKCPLCVRRLPDDGKGNKSGAASH